MTGPGPASAREREAVRTRWLVVAALFVVTACVSTSVSAFGVFLPVLADTFGWSRGAVSMALSINLFFGGVTAFGVASVADRHGPRGVLVGTALIGAAGFLLTSRVQELWQFYLCYGVLVGTGMSSIYVLSTATVSRWFTDRRGLALAVVLSGFNLGWLMGGPFAAMLIERWGWRAAYVVLGLCVGGIAGPTSLLVRYPERHGGAGAAGGRDRSAVRHAFRAAMTDRRLWQLVGAWFCLGLVYMTVTVHSVPFARDLGLPLDRASLLLTGYGVGATVGRLVSGAVADRFGALATMHGCVFIQATALVVLLIGPPPWALTAVLVAFGLGASGADNAFVKVVPEVFGLLALASVMGVLGLGWRTGGASGPAAAGFLYDATGSYTIAFTGVLVVLGVAGVLFSLGSRPTADASVRG
ncbi:MAG: MFS transporter [Candidatus Rokuibacteriota bacterium]